MEKKKISKKVVSYSQYAIYRDCPYRWYLTYVQRAAPFTPSIHTTFGTSLHGTLQLWLKVMYSQSGVAADKMDLESDFKTRFIEEYKKRVADNNGEHFSTKEELKEFYEDGAAILKWIRKKRNKYFTLRNVELVGIEIPVLIQANKGIDNVSFKGAIDFVLYDKDLNKYTIYDIKTSTRGWTPEDKKDQKRINQVLLYKKAFAQVHEVPIENIDVLFFIVKRKVPENTDFPLKRVQEFKPADGSVSLNKATKDFQSFLTECFTPQGTHQEKAYYKNAGDSCKWCPFKDREDLCDKKN